MLSEMRYLRALQITHTPSHGLLSRECAINMRCEGSRGMAALTMILLPGTLAALRTVRTGHDMLLEEALLALPNPPVTETIQQHLCGAHSTYPRPWRIGIRVDAPSNRVQIHEEVKFDKWRKSPRLGLHMRDNLLKIARMSWRGALGEMLWDAPLGRCASARGLGQSGSLA